MSRVFGMVDIIQHLLGFDNTGAPGTPLCAFAPFVVPACCGHLFSEVSSDGAGRQPAAMPLTPISQTFWTLGHLVSKAYSKGIVAPLCQIEIVPAKCPSVQCLVRAC